MAILHERMAAETKLRLLTLALAHELGIRISGRAVGGVGTTLATDVDHALIVWPTAGWPVLAPQALGGRGPGFDQRAIDGEVLIGEQFQLARLAHYRIEETTGQFAVNQPLAQAREIRLIQPGLLQIHVQKT